MNLFKKALIAVLGLGLVVAPSANRHVEEVEAAAGGTVTLKLDSSTWGSASAYYSIHYWGGDTSTSWPGNKFNGGQSAKGSAEITANYDETSTHCIIIRWGNSGCTTEWNRWDYFDINTMSTKYNYFTNNGWTSCSSKYVESTVVKEKYTYTYYDGSNVLKTETLVEGDSWGYYFHEKEGYRLEGWYTDASLTNKYVKGTEVTANTNLYANYVPAENYKLYFNDNGTFGTSVNAYMWRDLDGTFDSTWPGSAITKEGSYWVVEVDASKSYDKIIFNNGSLQTVNIDMAYENTFYTLGKKDSAGNYEVAVETSETAIAEEVNLKAYYQTKETSVRVLSSLGVNEGTFKPSSLNRVGFKFEYNGKIIEKDSGFIYTSVVADGETISAAETYGAQYFFVATFNNVPAGTSFTATPYAELTNGYVYYGVAITVSL